ncbi:pilin [Actinosynnema sp. CA-299493]
MLVLAKVVLLVLLAPGSAAQADTVVLTIAGSVDEVLNNIRNWLMGILAGLATVFLTVGGVRRVFGAGDPGEQEKSAASTAHPHQRNMSLTGLGSASPSIGGVTTVGIRATRRSVRRPGTVPGAVSTEHDELTDGIATDDGAVHDSAAEPVPEPAVGSASTAAVPARTDASGGVRVRDSQPRRLHRGGHRRVPAPAGRRVAQRPVGLGGQQSAVHADAGRPAQGRGDLGAVASRPMSTCTTEYSAR